jgi:hypothetical protein
MQTSLAACGILILTATLTSAAGSAGVPHCTLTFDHGGLAQIAPSAAMTERGNTLCSAAQRAVEEQPALVRALVRQEASLSLNISADEKTHLSARLVLHLNGKDLSGQELIMSEVDRQSGLGSRALSRLARQLLGGEPFVSFSMEP